MHETRKKITDKMHKKLEKEDTKQKITNTKRRQTLN